MTRALSLLLLCLASLASLALSAPADLNTDSASAQRCTESNYICKSDNPYRLLCVSLEQLCDGKQDCPDGDDEQNVLCDAKRDLEQQVAELEKKQTNNGLENEFSGTGFMFSVNNLVIDGGSNVKMFNQNSDNVGQPGPENSESKELEMSQPVLM